MPLLTTWGIYYCLFAKTNLWFYRKAIRNENKSDLLKDISPARLSVYQNMDSFEMRETLSPLDEEADIAALGLSKKEAVWVVVPAPLASVQGNHFCYRFLILVVL